MAENVVTDRQTDRQTDGLTDPRCACAPRALPNSPPSHLQSQVQVSGSLYQVQSVTVQVASPFKTAGQFDVHLHESTDPSLLTIPSPGTRWIIIVDHTYMYCSISNVQLRTCTIVHSTHTQSSDNTELAQVTFISYAC